ncbi:acyltransferase [Ramlibacter sp.]|uniref:acyltransferase family protein n=1 Tax=Ramlibacter sp. TaxID=1917967 RepID=UPI0017C63802|nr:acyltransferase [Ramlibacter sp.]MBA2673672.1 acyltransferase [Ramlibacter sp.]
MQNDKYPVHRLQTGGFERRDAVLDAWRGISVLMVISSHLVDRHPAVNPGELHRLFENAGSLGVKIFFAISGFIITTLLLRERRAHGRISLRAFYVRRAFRILPPLWLFLLAVLAAALAGLIIDPGPLLGASTFLCNTKWASCLWFVAHTWSLAIEEQFYLFWPPALVMLLQLGSRRAVRWAPAVLMLLFLALGQMSIWTINWLNNGLSFACIAAGAWCASDRALRYRIHRAASPMALLACFAALILRPLVPIYFPGQYRLQDLFTPLMICFLLCGTLRFKAQLEHSIIVRCLAGIGLISYSLYLWQQLFLARAEFYVAGPFPWLWPICLVIALLSYVLVERPFVRMGRRVSGELAQRALP